MITPTHLRRIIPLQVTVLITLTLLAICSTGVLQTGTVRAQIDLGPTAAVGTPQQAGLVVVSAPSGPDISTVSTSFVDVPQMKGAFTLVSAGDVAMTFCAETSVTAGKRMFARALVDGSPASPSDVVFAATSNLDSHCFTFVRNAVPAGVHNARIQWLVDTAGTAFAGDRTLHITFAQAGASEFSLLAAAAPSGPAEVIRDSWADIPGMHRVVNLPATGDLAITFSGETYTTNSKRLFLRALVDGSVAAPSDAVLAIGPYTGTRAFGFVKQNVPAGAHDIRLQGLADSGGEGYVGDRTLAVFGVSGSAVRYAGSRMIAAPSGPWVTTTSANWVDIPGLSGIINVPTKGDVVMDFSAELWAGAGQRVFVRALVDGVAANPSDALIVTGGWTGAYAFTFARRNLDRGQHTVTLQWTVDPGSTAGIGDRTLVAYTLAMQQPVLFIGMESDRDPGYPYGGYFSSSVVEVINGQRVFRPSVRQRLFGSVYPGVADYFVENSAGRSFIAEAGILGPYKKSCGNEEDCRAQTEPFTKMLKDAWEQADKNFDFSVYDRDGNGTVSSAELVIYVLFYQDTTAGFVRDMPAVVTNDGVTLDGLNQPHGYLPNVTQSDAIGEIAHELMHVIINAGDMYENAVTLPNTGGWDPTAPGPYSLMDQHFNYPHLDPHHKLQAGDWFDPITVGQDGYYDITAVEQQPSIYKLHDPSSHPGEYFLVENRQRIGYDQLLPDTGLAIWHIDELRQTTDYWRRNVEIMAAGGATNPLQFQDFLWDSANNLWGRDFSVSSNPSNARWHDGSASGIGVWAIPASSSVMRVYLDVPGPGILVDAKPDKRLFVPSGAAVTLQIRLVNTGSSGDTFALSVSQPGAHWSANPVTLAPYEQRIVTLTFTPVWSGGQNEVMVDVSGHSVSDPGVSTSDTVALAKGAQVYMPLIRKAQ